MPGCGTPEGYDAHRWAGEETCRPCRDAHTAQMRDYYDNNPAAKARRNTYGKARYRALQRLADLHYTEFMTLLAEERARAEAEAAKGAAS